MEDQEVDARHAFTARVSLYWESVGFPRAVGAILGHLMVCEPAAQTQAEIATTLGLSTGSVSTQLKSLLSIGLVEPVRRPGERALRYQLPQDVWAGVVKSEMERMVGLRELADAGADVVPVTRPDRIAGLAVVMDFFEAEWPRLMDRFDEHLRKERS